MSISPTILVYGKDENLLKTRALVLETAGHRVQRAATPQRLRLLLQNDPIGVLILCHTLSEAECLEALDTAARMKPGIKSLVLTHRHSRWGEGGVSAVITDLLNPALLVSMAAKLSDECGELRN
jgi:DNA-binding NtrC family response regulator